jgi:hypothetical protein
VFAAIVTAAGLPAPIREYRFAPPRLWRFDLAWPFLRLALEIEGGTWTAGRHVRGKGYENDCEKYNAAALAGWRVLRVTTDMIQDGRALALDFPDESVVSAWRLRLFRGKPSVSDPCLPKRARYSMGDSHNDPPLGVFGEKIVATVPSGGLTSSAGGVGEAQGSSIGERSA